MTERDYVRSLRRHWRLGLACLLLSVVGAAVFTATAAPVYRATATLFASTRIDDPGAAYQAGMFTQQRVQSYATIVDAPSVMEAVIARLDLPETPDELAAKVSADAPLNTVLIKVSAQDGSAARARAIANAVAEEFGNTVGELETAAGNDISPIEVTLVRPAGRPASPVEPRPLLNLALGALIGAAIGFGIALLRDSLDRTVKSVDIEERLGIPVLALIPSGNSTRKGPVVTLARPRSRQAEAFRTLRTNLQFADLESPPRSIVVTSAVEQEGKTTTLGNLAVVLAQAGNSVIVVSGDLRRPMLNELLGVKSAAGLTNVLAGQATLDETLQSWGDPNLPLSVLPSGPLPANPSELLGSRKMRELVRTLEERATFVLIDAPPVLPFTDAAVASAAASGVLLVVRNGKTLYDEVRRAGRALDAVGARVYGAVVTMAPTHGVDASYASAYHYADGPSGPAPLPPVAGTPEAADVGASAPLLRDQ